ncbi:MAG: hypothetical protein ABW193_12615 [Luteibacter sp.]
MMAWEQNVNRELGDLNDAHSAARIDTPEYRRRRRALLNDTLRQEGIASHTLRRPAAATVARIGAATRLGGVGAMRAEPPRPAKARSRPAGARPSALRVFWWCFAIAAIGSGIATWLTLWPPI